MIKKEVIWAIKDKQMDRKGFLKYSGLIIFSVVGLSMFYDVINTANSQDRLTNKPARGRYGI